MTVRPSRKTRIQWRLIGVPSGIVSRGSKDGTTDRSGGLGFDDRGLPDELGEVGLAQPFHQLGLGIAPQWAQRAVFAKLASGRIVGAFIQGNRTINRLDH